MVEGQASVFGDGATDDTAVPGVLDGQSGSRNYFLFEYPNGEIYEAKMKDLISHIPAKTICKQRAGGGGGFGNPLERSVELVAREVKYGYVSVESAEKDYGVVMNDMQKGTVDEEKTNALRKSI